MSTIAQAPLQGLMECMNDWEDWQVDNTDELNRTAVESQRLLEELSSFAEHLRLREAELVARENKLNAYDDSEQRHALQETAKATQARMGELVNIFSDLRDELSHQETIEQLRTEIGNLRKLNARLAAELSVARGRSKQLYQAMLCQQQLLEQRGVVTDNLLHIRRLLHSHSELLAHLAQISQRSGVEPIENENQEEDPILNGLLQDLRSELEEFSAATEDVEPVENNG